MFQTHLPKNPMQLGTSFSWFAEPRIPRALVSYVRVEGADSEPHRRRMHSPCCGVVLCCLQVVGNWVSQWANDLLVWENKMFSRRPVLVKGDGPMGRVRAWYRQFCTFRTPGDDVRGVVLPLLWCFFLW